MRLTGRQPISVLFLLVLALDQLTKTLALSVLAQGEVIATPLAGVALVSAPIATSSAAYARLLVFGLLILLLLVRLVRREGRGGDLAGPAIQLMAGGLTSTAIDVFLLREKIGVLAASLGEVDVLLSVANAAVLVGAILFLIDIAQRRWVPQSPVFPLSDAPASEVQLGDLRRGIDNVRVDVTLSPSFEDATGDVVSNLLTQQVWHRSSNRSHVQPGERALEAFRRPYLQLVETALHRAKREEDPMRVPLAQLAAAKYVLQTVESEFDRLVRELRTALDYSPSSLGRRSVARTHEQLVRLRRQRQSVIRNVSRLLLQQMQHVNNGPLLELSRSVLGESIGLPASLLANPLLHVEGGGDAELLMSHYVLLGQRSDDPFNPNRVERMLRDFFASQGLCDSSLEEEGETTEDARQSPCSWFTEPANAALLLDIDGYLREAHRAQMRGEGERARECRRHARFQRRLLRRLDHLLRAEGFMGVLLASYEVPELVRSLDVSINPHALHRYIANPRARPEIAARIRKLDRRSDPEATLQVLDASVRRVERCSRTQRIQLVHRFLRDFMTYRRDLAQARRARRWMDEIRLLDSADDIRLSQANGMLYDLATREDTRSVREAPVTGHVVIKADVRGSTRIAQELIDRGLNPATHFGLNFFEPIKSLIELYGAQKVFVEGDAIILAILEREGDDASQQFAVARACGLARSILEVVAAHNATGSSYGLPELELGVGIAYEPHPPTYLFDDERPIMISPAIARADRLSSCTAFLRERCESRAGRRIRVYAADAPSAYDVKGTSVFRFNVNGIELEPDAFARLEEALRLKRVNATTFGSTNDGFLWGRYPDVRGVMRNMLVRRGRVKPLRRDTAHDAERAHYYEVVVDPCEVTDAEESTERHGPINTRLDQSKRG